MRNVRKLFTALVGAPLLVWAGIPTLHAAEPGILKMRFTQSGNTSASWPLYIAEQKKMLEKKGLQVEVIIIPGAERGTPGSERNDPHRSDQSGCGDQRD